MSVKYCGLAVAERSQMVVGGQINDVLALQGHSGMQFIDATPALRAAASSSTIYGPNDWDHLNRTGYQVLGALVASQVGNDRSAKSHPDTER